VHARHSQAARGACFQFSRLKPQQMQGPAHALHRYMHSNLPSNGNNSKITVHLEQFFFFLKRTIETTNSNHHAFQISALIQALLYPIFTTFKTLDDILHNVVLFLCSFTKQASVDTNELHGGQLNPILFFKKTYIVQDIIHYLYNVR
jgi:hypothetical protein